MSRVQRNRVPIFLPTHRSVVQRDPDLPEPVRQVTGGLYLTPTGGEALLLGVSGPLFDFGETYRADALVARCDGPRKFEKR